jgi:hypothetical protein
LTFEVTTRSLQEKGVAAVALLLAALWAVNVYRAWTQSITFDEAVTYDAFVVGPLSNAFTGYNANNHVLFTALAKISTRAFGISELSLRLPSVAAGAIYFAVIFSLCRLLFGRGAIFSVTVAALALNPFVLDFLSAARGYGVALALFMMAFYQLVVILVRSPSEGPPATSSWVAVSLALAGSVSANLAFLFPAVGLGLAALTVAAFEQLGSGRRSVVSFCRTTVLPLCAPGPAAACAFLAVPLSLAKPEHFTYGAGRLSETVTSLVDASVRHHPSGWPINALGAILASVEAKVLVPLILAALLATAAIVTTRAVRGRKGLPLIREDRILLLLTGTLGATLAELIAARRLWDVPYPHDRTGLYFIPMFILAAALLVQRIPAWGRWSRGVRAASLTLLGLLVAQSAAQFNVTQYAMWRFNSGARMLYDITARWPEPDREKPFRIAGSWLLYPSLEYYRRLDATSRVSAVSDGLDGIQTNQFDFAILSDWHWSDMDLVQEAVSLVCVHPASDALLFVNQASAAARALDTVRHGASPGVDCSSLQAVPR